MNEPSDSATKKDRKLGDEWENWTGDLDESTAYNETAALFTVFASIAMIVLLSCFGFILYICMISIHFYHLLIFSLTNNTH